MSTKQEALRRRFGRRLVKLGESPERRMMRKGTITLLFASLFAIILVTVHVVEPEMNFGPVSLYPLGPFGVVMRTGFVVLGLAFFSMVAELRGRARPTILYYVDLIMLSTAGVGLITVGVFNTDAPGTSPTLSGLIHGSAANAWSICTLVGVLLFAIAFRQDGRSLAIGQLSKNTGIALMITYFAGFFAYGTPLAAVQPRLFFSIVVLWMCFIASRLRSGKLTTVAANRGND